MKTASEKSIRPITVLKADGSTPEAPTVAAPTTLGGLRVSSKNPGLIWLQVIWACWVLIGTMPSNASFVDPEVSAILENPLEMRWAYFTDVSGDRWYIVNIQSGGKKNIYSLMPLKRNLAGWGTVGEDVSRVDLERQTVRTDSSLDHNRSDLYYDEGLKEWNRNEQIIVDRRLIQGSTVPVKWYFFHVPSLDSWFIVNAPGYGVGTHILKFTARNNDYFWMPVNATDLQPSFTIEGGKKIVRFHSGHPNSFKLPLPGNWNWRVTANAGDPSRGTHEGNNFYSLDFSASGYSGDVPIYAMHGGKVMEVFKGPPNINIYGDAFKGFPRNGYFVRIDQDKDNNLNTGLTTVYLHFAFPPVVSKNDIVEEGDLLGYMGDTGEADGKHLHITVRYDGDGTEGQAEVDQVRIEGRRIRDFEVGLSYRSTR